jgi:molecular chaperone HtpG
MVADKVEIETLSYQDGAEPARWICDGSTEFEITEGNKTERGTDIILYINARSEEFLNEIAAGDTEQVCKFLPVPIKFGTKQNRRRWRR